MRKLIKREVRMNCRQPIYSDEEKSRIELVMTYIKDCGEYAGKFRDGEISEEDLDIEKLACTEDNLYDRIADAVGFLQAEFPEPIPFERNGNVKR